ncbi:hypothetical protein SPOG_04995 [Schizosaccharomyces cryophilus OY26]|uniref:Uncharacterized protein n=1 Tax=Schizosaccharomyces cryophilus (strain OY26 / ATCC MYA-4695 / CBS 11777 / NBRC 106824 / NRRL Y48691) TaxID=653667 RepID=S9VSP2_SCHCR|nr:uncharacterized protein SPOG_04995 [Schizosaccharomyces cryophilus OY26]EPY49155.1 hypothetical protein SPOG_04995 [Schizosaccharomyces cryophilus OY26]
MASEALAPVSSYIIDAAKVLSRLKPEPRTAPSVSPSPTGLGVALLIAATETLFFSVTFCITIHENK